MAISLAQASSMDLSQDYNFTGTVTGMGTAGAMTLIKTLTASSSNSLSFVNGSNGVVLDSTYKSYKFVFKNIHPATDGVNFQFQGSTDGGSNYNTTMTTTYFDSIHREDDAGGSIQYQSANDLAQSTSYQNLARSTDNDNDSNISGELWLYNPSSTTYVKHFMNRLNHTFNSTPQHTMDTFVAGYFNTTSAINAVDFKMSSGDIDDGTISLYGIS